jgi:subtilase family serine protease
LGAKPGGAKRSPKLLASALSVMAPLALPRAVTAQTTAFSPPLAPVGAVPSPPADGVPIGALPSGTPIQLSVALRSSDPKGLFRTALAVSTPGSPEYRHYLTPAEVKQRFGPLPGATAAVDAYLSSHGLTLGPTLADGLIVTASGTAETVNGALHTGLMTYRQRSGRVVYANSSPPQMPSSVAPGVESVIGLDDAVQLHPQLSRSPRLRSPAATSLVSTISTSPAVEGAARPCAAATSAASAAGGYTADQLASAYGFVSSYQSHELGTGVTVGVFELAGYSKDDLRSFESCYGIKAKIATRNVDGGASLGSGTIEAELDIEGIASMAPKAKVLVYEAPNTDTGVLDAYGAMESDDKAKVVSTSWGICEFQAGQIAGQEEKIFAGMAAQGQSVVAAAGDTGSEDCYASDKGLSALEVDDPASQPFVTGVGGTNLTSVGSPPAESVWNDKSGAGGGGISQFWSMPSWQAGPGVVNSYSTGGLCGASGYCREVPDVSASADPNNGYIVFCSVSRLCKLSGGSWFEIGGTSAAAPLWSSLLALADQGLASPIGFANPALYSIATSGPPGNAFNDITAGHNDFTGTNGGRYPATANFDLASGWGSPIGTKLIPFLRG